MGMAAIGVALWRYTMSYSPTNPGWFNRDRFVLSNGHTCLFQYTFLHLTGYRHMSMSQLRSYHSARHDSFCPGHPEIEHDGIEVTTGPLGQGIANAVGLAMAGTHLAAVYNRPGFAVVGGRIWCVTGDACLQEGVGLEAISLAGHWRLENLVLVYDNNAITCDGSVDICNSEDVNAKMRACGWDVVDVEDGCYDVPALVAALHRARASVGKPTFVNVRTVIGVGSNRAGDAKAHGAAFGPDGVREIKQRAEFDPDEHFVVPPAVSEFFADLPARGKALEAEWSTLMAAYRVAHPALAAEFDQRLRGEFTLDNWASLIPAKSALPTKPTASRVSAGLVLNPLAAALPSFMVGTADLSPSVNMSWPSAEPFQNPSLVPTRGSRGSYAGRYIHYGIREHAMAAISNGLAAFHPHAILPVTSSFFMFYLYAAPGVRMGALQNLQAIHIATHDSIGTGEDGPTHQPIALPALYRAMPNMLYIRPCDSEETAGALLAALAARDRPSILSLSRQALPQWPQYSSRDAVAQGAYVFRDHPAAVITLLGVGPELCFAMAAADVLTTEHNLPTRVVSFPCQALFDAQPAAYRRSVLRRGTTGVVAVEAYAMNGWERYADAGYGMRSFGKSLPGKDAYAFFGFDGGKIAAAVRTWWEEVEAAGGVGGGAMREIGWRELNDVPAGH
ncbi:Transketolase, thiamine diphosphate binding domain-containing protein [Geopyxis carbonaria]|nr:Transketolase, thiamine diphosphate binding domain-containing protein [Geopyxis carbonaria]